MGDDGGARGRLLGWRIDPEKGQVARVQVDGLAIEHTVEFERSQVPVRIVAIDRGVVSVENHDLHTTRYTIATGAQAPARIFLQHRARFDYQPVDLPPSSHPSGGAYMIPVPIRAQRASVVPIVERRTVSRTMRVLDRDSDKEVQAYLATSELPVAVVSVPGIVL